MSGTPSCWEIQHHPDKATELAVVGDDGEDDDVIEVVSNRVNGYPVRDEAGNKNLKLPNSSLNAISASRAVDAAEEEEGVEEP